VERNRNFRRTRCPVCRGTGIDRTLHRRYTSGGHDDRTCRECLGECYIDIDGEERSPDGRYPERKESDDSAY
jgi:hypothetical protein